MQLGVSAEMQSLQEENTQLRGELNKKRLQTTAHNKSVTVDSPGRQLDDMIRERSEERALHVLGWSPMCYGTKLTSSEVGKGGRRYEGGACHSEESI